MYSSKKAYIVTPHLNSLTETVLMRGDNICFYAKIRKIIPKLSLLPVLIWSSEEESVKHYLFRQTLYANSVNLQ